MANFPPTSAKPEIVPVTDLLDSVMSGEMLVPRFQRPYVWSPDDMIQLFDSVVRGYPIGSLLIWQTDRDDISSLKMIGPIQLPGDGPLLKSYVVDGHQRLATLLGVLRLPEDHPRQLMDDWRWWIVYDLVAEQFIHLKDNRTIIPLTLLPLRSILRTVDFARRTREIASSSEFDESTVNELLDRADAVQRAIRDYRIPMTVMKSGSLDDAVTIFSRVNQRGRDMTADQMVSALTFRDQGEDNFDLAASIDIVLGELRPSGFGDLHRKIVLQVILALADLDFTRPSYEKIVNRASYKQMRPAVDFAKSAMKNAVAFLYDEVGLKTSRLLPYASIVVMLSIFFSKAEAENIISNDSQIQILKKWFWATSFNGWFAGANTTDIRQAAELMKRLASDFGEVEDDFKALFFSRPIRPFPESFDRRSARVRASLLVQILVGGPLEPADGKKIDGMEIFGDASTRDIPYFFPNQRRPIVSNPANRVILPVGYPRNVRNTFLSLLTYDSNREILESHFISEEAFEFLKQDDFEKFISAREQHILAGEKRFLANIGLTLDSTAGRNTDEIDTDD